MVIAIAGAVSPWATRPAHAQPESLLQQAEGAYERVDFEATRSLAQRVLEGGGNDRRRLVRIYYLLAVSQAATQQPDKARESFETMLLLEPETTLGSDLAPQLRNLLLEAKGVLSSRGGALGAFAHAMKSGDRVEVTLVDPLAMADEVVLHLRQTPSGAFTEKRVPAAQRLEIPVPEAKRANVVYYVTVLDRFKNEIVNVGSAQDPTSISNEGAGEGTQRTTTVALAPQPAPGDSPATGGRRIARPWFWTGVTGAVLGAVALGGAGAAYFIREHHATEYNNADCLRNGVTRDENCGSTRSAAESAGTWATVGAIAGGAFLATSVVIFVAGPREGKASSLAVGVACRPGPGTVGVACGASF